MVAQNKPTGPRLKIPHRSPTIRHDTASVWLQGLGTALMLCLIVGVGAFFGFGWWLALQLMDWIF